MADLLKAVQLSDETIHLIQQDTRSNAKHPTNPISAELENSEPTSCLLEELKTQAYEEGYQQGYKLGKQEGHQQGELQAITAINQQRVQMQSLFNSIDNALNQSRLQLQDDIANIVFVIIQQFFIHQQQNKELIAQQINHVLQQINHSQAIELSLHPHDLQLLQQGDLDLNLHDMGKVRIIANEQLELGGCIIKSEHGLFDASIEKQINNLKKVLLQIKGKHHV